MENFEEFDDLVPSPSRLVESLRDTGYSYQAAFADIVDNSIAANATIVEIDISESIFSNDVTVNFYDNGSGMGPEMLTEAMRYGSKKRTSPKSLGKFGMGLKTASTAFCRKLTVISKCNGEYSARCWDIDLIIKANKWLLKTPDLEEYSEQVSRLESVTNGGNGTIVIWESVDRLISASGSDYSDQAIKQLTEDVREHLGATFGKFLIGKKRFKSPEGKGEGTGDVVININSEPLIGFNPTGTQLNSIEKDRVLIERTQHTVSSAVNGSTVTGKFELNGYVLPNQNKMNDAELESIRYSNDSQGFYIYREDRLIYGGGWPHRLFSQDSHLNLLRVELNFDHSLDEYFEIDIRKSKINLPLKIRNDFRKFLAPWRNEAQTRYRGERPPRPSPTPSPDNPVTNSSIHRESSIAIERQEKNISSVRVLDSNLEKSILKIENRFGEIEISRAGLACGTDVLVATTDSLENGMLWEIDFTDDNRTVVILNENHDFYRRFYLSSSVGQASILAMDSLFWSLAKGELNSTSQVAKDNFEELRFSLSNSLKRLANELPDEES